MNNTLAPVHDHSCGACVFLGQDAPAAPHETKANVVDMYLCRTVNGVPLLIRRWSSENDANSCCRVEWVDEPWWQAALEAAKTKGGVL